jgi:tripartite-type tricarboxylate transporter receptor subunit TctC
MLNRRLNLLALALGLFMAQNAVMAQDFLSKPVRIVVPQTTGRCLGRAGPHRGPKAQ